MIPDDFRRITDARTGPLRFFELERKRALAYTNGLYQKAVDPYEQALRRFADELREAVSLTHHIHPTKAVHIGVRTITLHFPDLGKPYLHIGGELVVNLPYERRWDSSQKHGVKPDMPWAQIRRPGDAMVFRRRMIRSNENPASIWQRFEKHFAVHAKATQAIAA